MTVEILDRLECSFEDLIAALDGQDADAIIDAAAAIRPIVTEVESKGAWRDGGETRARLQSLSKLVDASKYRVNKLTDLSRQRAENLTLALGQNLSPTYKKRP
ncbi:hypothetical protein MNBD_ALPHA04-1615 [hydrothermal vent metagenome]|uniref:Uncharacterized protein n=1 Tax=hydrothermal vent metagenome TaxID=652676 RepID=A0A3B0S891_9ZZZZ